MGLYVGKTIQVANWKNLTPNLTFSEIRGLNKSIPLARCMPIHIGASQRRILSSSSLLIGYPLRFFAMRSPANASETQLDTSWVHFAKRLATYADLDFDKKHRLITHTTAKFCLKQLLGQPILPEQNIKDTVDQLSDALKNQLEKEKHAMKQPLHRAFLESGVSISDFRYEETTFVAQVLSPDHAYMSKLQEALLKLIVSPSLAHRATLTSSAGNEKYHFLNFSDYHWAHHQFEVTVPLIGKVEEDQNIENKTFNQLSIEAISSEGTFLRELGCGTGDRLLTILYSLYGERNKVNSLAAAYASDINPRNFLLGHFALDSLECSQLPISINRGHFLGKFNYPPQIPYKNQVIMLSRVLTVCDAERLNQLMIHMNRSMKIGDKLICSFAPPKGTLYLAFIKDKSMQSSPLNHGLNGKVFWEKVQLDPKKKTYLAENYGIDTFDLIHHTFVDYKSNKTFFEKRGFEDVNHVLLQENQDLSLNNDRELVVLEKKQEVNQVVSS